MSSPLQAAPPAGFICEEVIGSMMQPMSMRFLPDGRLLVLEKKGLIHICDVTTVPAQSAAYMDFRNSAHMFGIESKQERGLIDVAIDPDFPAEPYIYVYYTPSDGPDGRRARISRYTHLENSGGLASRGDYASEIILWQDTASGYGPCCHYGGGLDFGPDGKLWLTTGDQFSIVFPAGVTQAPGGIHRINRDGSIPADNPFADGSGPNVDSKIAYGLRNPFRARWDMVGNRLFIGEVGGNDQPKAWEDLHVLDYDPLSGQLVDDDFGTPGDNNQFDGINYGWPTVEGLPPHTDFPGANVDAVGEPIFAYQHGGDISAITGGVVYRGGTFPAPYHGAYFYGDSTRDFIRYIKFDQNGNVVPNPFPDPISNANPDAISYPFDLSPVGRVVSLEVGPDGALYYLNFSDAGGAYGQPNPSLPGSLRRYVSTGANTTPVVTISSPADSGFEIEGNSVSFTATATDLEDGNLTSSLAWTSDIDGPIGSGGSFSRSDLSSGVHIITASVTNAGGVMGSDAILFSVQSSTGSDLLAHWHLDEASGPTAFDAQGVHDGALNTGPTWQPSGGRLAGALQFAGGSEKVTVPSFEIPGDKLSVALWVKPTSFAGHGVEARFVSKASGTMEQAHYWMVGNYGNGTAVRFRLKTTVGGTSTLVTPAGRLALDQWSHVVATYDGASMKVFVNGTEEGSLAKTGNITLSGGTDIGIGNQPVGDSRGLIGSLDDIRILSRVLSPVEITTLANPPNAVPFVTITSPSPATTVNQGVLVTFAATADDAEDGDLSGALSWSSDLDGVIGSGPTFDLTTLSPGDHTITATASDGDSATGSDSLGITVTSASSFSNWLTINGYTSGGFHTDSDNNGLIDGGEYFFNQSPNDSGDLRNLPKIVRNGADIELHFTRLTAADDAIGTLQTSGTLGGWNPAIPDTDYGIVSGTELGVETQFIFKLLRPAPSFWRFDIEEAAP